MREETDGNYVSRRARDGRIGRWLLAPSDAGAIRAAGDVCGRVQSVEPRRRGPRRAGDDGTFEVTAALPVGTPGVTINPSAVALALADVDGDMRLDIVA